MKTVSFTGHRPQKLGGFNPNNPIMIEVEKKLKAIIIELINKGYNRFISGGALGVDQLVCKLVLELKKSNPDLKLIIAKPFPSQSKVWSKDQQIIFEKYISLSDEVIAVSQDPYTAYKLQVRNEWMINHSDLLVAVWDGSPSGTKNTIIYAKKKNKEIIYLKP